MKFVSNVPFGGGTFVAGIVTRWDSREYSFTTKDDVAVRRTSPVDCSMVISSGAEDAPFWTERETTLIKLNISKVKPD